MLTVNLTIFEDVLTKITQAFNYLTYFYFSLSHHAWLYDNYITLEKLPDWLWDMLGSIWSWLHSAGSCQTEQQLLTSPWQVVCLHSAVSLPQNWVELFLLAGWSSSVTGVRTSYYQKHFIQFWSQNISFMVECGTAVLFSSSSDFVVCNFFSQCIW